MEEHMHRTGKLGATAVAIVLLVAGGARAATPTKGQAASDIGFAWATTTWGARLFVTVGCDGAYPQQSARAQALSARTGAVVWDAPASSRFGCFRNVLAAGDDVFVSGEVADDDGDGGFNLLVRRYRGRDGALLWEQEFEAPNPKQDIVNTVAQLGESELRRCAALGVDRHHGGRQPELAAAPRSRDRSLAAARTLTQRRAAVTTGAAP
jgi:hypothetical protein